MKKPVVDYRKLRFSNLNTPEFSHLWYLLGWVFYFAMYFITENFIPVESCHPIHSVLDDLIPFCEYFAIPYVLWYVLVFGSLIYFLLYNPKSFKKLQTYIILTQVIAMATYILYPSRQDLRPDLDALGRENFFTWVISLLYGFDTNTGVLPSLHVAYSLGIASVWCKEKDVKPWFKMIIVIFVISVCLSVAFVKQHSILDAFAALLMCIPIELAVFWGYWKKRRCRE